MAGRERKRQKKEVLLEKEEENIKIQVGDTVKVRVKDDGRSKKKSIASNGGMCLAIVEKIYDDEDDLGAQHGDEEELEKEIMVKLRWYYWPNEIKGFVAEYDREVIETNHCDINSIHTIISSVHVVSSVDDVTDKKNCFVCDKFYSTDTQLIRKRFAAEAIETLSTQKINTRPPEQEKLVNACKELQLCAVPNQLPCRDKERKTIRNFIKSSVNFENQNRALYVSGMPGTGKTATVKEVVKSLQSTEKSCPSFKFVEINSMKLTTPPHLYVELYRLLFDTRVSLKEASQRLNDYFSDQRSNPEPIVLLVDEIDYIVTRDQNVVYNLWDWTFRPHSCLVLIGIANTMDLPERLLPKIQSRIGNNRLIFPPYNRDDLGKIIKARLHGLDVFDPSAIELCAAKVSGVSGDVRRALQICRRAAEICSNENRDRVVARDVIDATKELSANLRVQAISSASILEQIFLISAFNVMRIYEVEQCAFEKVFHRFLEICTGLDPNPIPFTPTRMDILGMCERLGSRRLILLEQKPADRDPIIRLEVNQDDLSFALQEHPICAKLVA